MTADSVRVLRLIAKQLSVRIEDFKRMLREVEVPPPIENLADNLKDSNGAVLLTGRGMSVEPPELAFEVAYSFGYNPDRDGDVLEFISKNPTLAGEYIKQLTDIENTQLPRKEHLAFVLMVKKGLISCNVTTNYTNEIEKMCILMNVPYTKSATDESHGSVFRVLHVNGDLRSIICESCGRVEYLPTILSPRIEYPVECHCGWKGWQQLPIS